MLFAFLLSVFVGILDGFGLTMFLPLLQIIADSTKEVVSEDLGKLGFVVEIFENNGFKLNLVNTLFLLTIFFVLKGLFKYLGSIYQVLIRQYFLKQMRLSLVSKFGAYSFENFLKSDQGRIQNTLTTETERITNAFAHYFKALNQGVLVVVYVFFAFTVDYIFATLVVVGGGLTNLLFRYIYKLSKNASRKLTVGNSVFHGWITQMVVSFKYLKSTGRVDEYAKHLKDSIDEIEVNNKKLGFYGAIAQSIREPILILVIAVVICIEVYLLKNSSALIMVSLIFFYRALSTLNNLQSTWNLFIKFSGSIENIQEFQKELELGADNDKGSLLFTNFTRSLKLKNVSFCFGENMVLGNIDLEICKNETVAFVGQSGSGKTTLLNVISGLLTSYNGRVDIDGQNVLDFNRESFHRQIGIIVQEPVIFRASLFDNITFWDEKSKVNINRFNEVIRKAELKDFFNEKGNQKDTFLEFGGANLSGGQKQRIAIARELYRNVQFLLLDEATSALDAQTEINIQNSIDSLKGNVTILIVAHRLATIKNADRIVYLENGKILDALPFNELVESNKKFAKLVQLQKI